jgi:hypothetical protein
MSTNRQKSFIATLELDEHLVDFLGVLYGTPALRHDTQFSGGVFTGATRTYDDSHLLGSRPQSEVKNITPLKIYFRCTDDYYHLYIRSHETYTGRCISKDDAGVLGAFPAAGSDTTTFNLLNLKNQTITLDNMANDVQWVRLKARNSGHIGAVFRRGAPYSYLAGVEEEGIVFKLHILERNAPYLSNPDEV